MASEVIHVERNRIGPNRARSYCGRIAERGVFVEKYEKADELRYCMSCRQAFRAWLRPLNTLLASPGGDE